MTKRLGKVQNIQFIKAIHILMLILCFLASIFLYFTKTFFYQVIISSILITYTAFLVVNAHLIKLVFGIINSPFSYSKRQQFSQPNNNTESTNEKQQKVVYIQNHLRKPIHLDKQKSNILSAKESGSILSEIWSSCYFSKQSIFSNRGLDLQNILLAQNQVSSKTSIQDNSPRMILIDRNTMARELLSNGIRQNQRLYQLQLKSTLKINQNQVKYKYTLLLKVIDKIINSKINQYKLLKNKIKHLFIEQLKSALLINKVSKVTSKCSIAALNRGFPIKFQYWSFIQELLMIYTQQKTAEIQYIDFKKYKETHILNNLICQIIQDLQRISSSLLINFSSLINNKNSNIKQFIALFRRNISMLQQFKKDVFKVLQDTQNQLGQYAQNAIDGDFKSKLFILFILIRQINNHLQKGQKISIVDYWNFGSMTYQERMCQIYAKNGFDCLYPHLNICSIDQNNNNKCIYCQPGRNNYLSVILMLIHKMGNDLQLLRKNTYISSLVHDIL